MARAGIHRRAAARVRPGRLTVTRAGVAEGRFLPGCVSFMLARSEIQAISDIPSWVTEPGAGQTRPARPGPEILADWMGAFIAQCAAPDACLLTMSVDGGPMSEYLVDTASRSAAALTRQPNGSYRVRQAGQEAVWDVVEDAVLTWRAAGSPGIEAFQIRAAHGEQVICLDTADE